MSEFLETILAGNAVSRWLTAAAFTLVMYVALWLLVRVGARRLAAMSARTKTEIDDFVARVLGKTHTSVLLLVSAYAGSQLLELPSRLTDAARHVAFIAAMLQVGIWLSAALTFAVELYEKRAGEGGSASTTTINALGFFGRLVIWAVIFLLALDNLGVDVTALVASLGVGGIAVALAVQSILGDLFASMSIVLDRPFEIGDFLSVGEHKGRVENIGLKTTRLRSLTGEQLVLSNGDLLASRIRNYGRMYERRAVFNLGVTYDTSREQLTRIPEIVRESIEAEEGVRFDRAHFKEYGAYSLNVEAVYYVLSPEYNVYLDIQQRINLEINRRFEAEGIEFAYPTQVVYVNPERHEAAEQAG